MKIIMNTSLFLKYSNFITIILIYNLQFNFSSENINTPKSKLILYFQAKKSSLEKKINSDETVFLDIHFLGNGYNIEISKYFGGECILDNCELNNKYYILISRDIESITKQSIRGYKVTNSEKSKMYILNLTVGNNKGDLTYNWNIEEIPIPTRALPDTTIMIYADPESVNFTGFDKNFNHIYPNKSITEVPIVILPLCILDIEKITSDQTKNQLSTINTKLGHTTIKEKITT